MGRGSSDLSAQDPHRPARVDGPSAHARRHLGLPTTQRKRVRHLRHRAFEHLDQRRAGHGASREVEGRESPGDSGDRRRRDVRGHGVRSDEQRRRDGCRSAGDPQRQRDVDLARGRRAQSLSGAAHDRALHRGAPSREAIVGRHATTLRARAARRGACEGHDGALDHVRGIRLHLFRPDRWSRPRFADSHPAQHPQPARTAIPARHHQERPGVQARRSRSGALSRSLEVRAGGRYRLGQRRRVRTNLHADLRRVAVRHGHARHPAGGHHAGHARRLRAGQVREDVSRPLLRRGHRRAARSHVRRRPCVRRPQTGGGDLFDVPAAWLRPADPRRVHPEPAGDVRARSGRAGGCRRGNASRRVRSVVPALPAEHHGVRAGR